MCGWNAHSRWPLRQITNAPENRTGDGSSQSQPCLILCYLNLGDRKPCDHSFGKPRSLHLGRGFFYSDRLLTPLYKVCRARQQSPDQPAAARWTLRSSGRASMHCGCSFRRATRLSAVHWPFASTLLDREHLEFGLWTLRFILALLNDPIERFNSDMEHRERNDLIVGGGALDFVGRPQSTFDESLRAAS